MKRELDNKKFTKISNINVNCKRTAFNGCGKFKARK